MSPSGDDNWTDINNIVNTTVQRGGVNTPYHARAETYIVPLVFAVIFLVGVIGNSTLIWVFLRNKVMRSVPNTFLVSLAAGDLTVLLFAVPFIGTIYTFESWPYGEFVCKLSEFLRDLSVGVTVLSLAALSVDRYVAVIKPLHKQRDERQKIMSITVVVVIWVISIGLAIPSAYFSFIYEMLAGGEVIKICYPFPPELGHWYPRATVLVKFLVLYVIPLVVISVFYTLMAQHLLLSTRQNVIKNASHTRQLEARHKVAWTVLSLAVIFCICFFPSHLFMLWFYFYSDSWNAYNDFWHAWKIVGYVLTFANSCLNPVALYCVSSVFRNYFQRYLFCCCHSVVHRQRTLTNRTTYTSLRSTIKNSATTKV
ncbi:neuropeptide CCHamide-1 receptor-like [Limulus polyphemus]|uniref:Neuropeptide CCHamide-1 receptor-like n=1 Tax=Limulus polyphemus TaxID=6850 RepID=A0ABM1B8Z5_LIMPO|nr:neuropeptide CCHamide-1 receptor-like [Limulus polyphemus]